MLSAIAADMRDEARKGMVLHGENVDAPGQGKGTRLVSQNDEAVVEWAPERWNCDRK